MLARGGGTSQCGQTVNHSLVVDCSKHLNRVLELDVENKRCVVEPGIVLDDPEPEIARAWTLVPGRCFHRIACNDRRYGRQQFLWRPFASLRHHA